MRILINTASSFKGGGIQVAKSYLEEFRKFSENEYYVVISESLQKAVNINEFPNNFQFFKAPFRPATKIFSFQSHNKFLKQIEKNWHPDIVFSTAGPSYWRPKTRHIMGYTIPHYVYPESPYFYLIGLKNRLLWFGRKILARYYFKRDADVIITQTDDITKRVQQFLGKEKVYTIYNTVNRFYTNPKKFANKLPIKKKQEFRLLTLSSWYPHKNLSCIPKVLEELELQGYNFIQFIATLPEEDYKKLGHPISNLINVGSVKIEEGASLYQECDALFLPTLLECFSASYAEAMVMYKPILTSDLGFSHAICGNAAIYFDPMNPIDIAAKIIKLYENKNLQQDLINKGANQLDKFGTAEERAKKILNICEDIVFENSK